MDPTLKTILKKIKKAKRIVIARHIGPDPDALGSQFGLRALIKANYPEKEVYAIGAPSYKLKFMGTLDKMTEDLYIDALGIILDTPDIKRIDGIELSKFKDVVKIDHHPYVDTFGETEWIEDSASSVSQMIMELAIKAKWQIDLPIAKILYIGLIADTNRFMYSSTTLKTFQILAKLLEQTNLDVSTCYDQLYMRPLNEFRFKGFLEQTLKLTENGFGYIIVNNDTLVDYGVDTASAGNMINDFNFVEGMYAWATIIEDVKNNIVRVSIRSRGPIVNEVAASFGGGGHEMASGVRLPNFELVDQLIADLDEVCKQYKQEL